VDYWGKPELLYLGPDEHIIVQDIQWLTQRAALRGMKYPAAFMSSKPDAGINHKEFGVTSEGVAVFLWVALEANGINPETQNFSVKITGGPNGDVAGNMIKILHRDYPHTAKVVGMSDHSGCVENTEGLDLSELLRLHLEDRAICDYDPACLNGGELNLVIKADGSPNSEGNQKRNSMHNRIIADVFVPAGGRPNTISALNWRHFLTPGGDPSSSLIVEAANIFITPEARKRLGDCGVMIVKDSSANKAGVCCSSYEIVASMLLSPEEFMENKKELVQDVLVKLRYIARQEAELLFQEAKANPTIQMPEIAVNISKAITRAGDAFSLFLEDNLDVISVDDRRRLVIDSLPKKLVEVAGDRLDDLPEAYTRAMLASSLSSRMVYSEGVEFVDSLSNAQLKQAAGNYLARTDLLSEILSEVENSELPNRKSIAELIRIGGIKGTMRLSGNK